MNKKYKPEKVKIFSNNHIHIVEEKYNNFLNDNYKKINIIDRKFQYDSNIVFIVLFYVEN